MHKEIMERRDSKKYIWVSSASSFVLPIFLIMLFLLFGLGPPESDSAEVQGVVFTVMTFPFIFGFQLLAYTLLGKTQLRKPKPSKMLGVIVGVVLSLPFTALVLFISLATGSTIFQGIAGAVLFMFVPLLVSFSVGSTVQCFLMGRHA